MQLYYQTRDGGQISIGFESQDKEEIKNQYWSFYNLKFLERGQLNWVRDDFAYINLTEQKFEQWLKASSIRMLENQNDIDFDENNNNHVKKLGKIILNRLANIKKEVFCPQIGFVSNDYYSCHTGKEKVGI